MSTVGGPRLSTIPSFINTYSLDFDGVDDYLNLGRITAMEGATNFSFSMWVYPTSYTGLKILFGKFASATDFFYAYTNNVFGYVFWHIADGQTNYPRVSTTSRIDLNTWGLLTFVYDGSLVGNLNKAKIYINGTLASTTTTAFQIPSSISLDTTDFYVAQRNGALSTPMAGKIDEVSAYDYSLSASEVAEIYNLGTPTDLSLLATPPLHWYRNGDNGSWKSPQWLIPNNENKDKVSNYSFEFDGIDDRVQLSSDFVASGEFTLSFWMKPVAVTGNGNIFPIGTFPDNQNHVRLDQIGVIYLKVQAVLCLFNEGVVGGGANNLVLDVWQHMTFIRDSSNVITCYRNGSTFGGTATNSGTLTLNSFGRVIANTFGFGGGLDGIAFWNSDQTSNLATIYNSGTPTTLPSGAVAHYKMGEDATFSGGVWTVPDSVGSNDGTSVNMTIEDRVGNAPNSTSNAVSLNMDEVDRATDVPT